MHTIRDFERGAKRWQSSGAYCASDSVFGSVARGFTAIIINQPQQGELVIQGGPWKRIFKDCYGSSLVYCSLLPH